MDFAKSLLRYGRVDQRTVKIPGGFSITARAYRHELNPDMAPTSLEIRHRENIPDDGNMVAHEHLVELFVRACLVAWDFTDDAGNIMPITRAQEVFCAKDPATGELLEEARLFFLNCVAPFQRAETFRLTADEISARANDLGNSSTSSDSRSPEAPKTPKSSSSKPSRRASSPPPSSRIM